MTQERDEAVRRALRDLRSGDEADAPEFNAVRTRTRTPVQFDALRLAGLAVAAGLVVVAAGALARQTRTTPRLVVPKEVIALSSWRPMTDALLYDSAALLPKDAKTGVMLARPRNDSSPE